MSCSLIRELSVDLTRCSVMIIGGYLIDLVLWKVAVVKAVIVQVAGEQVEVVRGVKVVQFRDFFIDLTSERYTGHGFKHLLLNLVVIEYQVILYIFVNLNPILCDNLPLRHRNRCNDVPDFFLSDYSSKTILFFCNMINFHFTANSVILGPFLISTQ